MLGKPGGYVEANGKGLVISLIMNYIIYTFYFDIILIYKYFTIFSTSLKFSSEISMTIFFQFSKYYSEKLSATLILSKSILSQLRVKKSSNKNMATAYQVLLWDSCDKNRKKMPSFPSIFNSNIFKQKFCCNFHSY